jgi:membrane associated rhomboid family serine protease
MYQIFLFIQFKVSVAFYLLFWLGLQLLFSTLGAHGVAWFAHIGGFLVGAAGIWLLKAAGLVKPDPHAAPQPA